MMSVEVMAGVKDRDSSHALMTKISYTPLLCNMSQAAVAEESVTLSHSFLLFKYSRDAAVPKYKFGVYVND
jgi:hypothetical protein